MRKFLVFIISFITLCANTAVFAQINGQEAINSVKNIEIQTENTQQVKTGETKQEQIDKLNEEMGLGEQKQIVIDDIKSSPNDNVALTKKVVPDTKSELTKMVKMFLKVMLAVAISTVIIFVVLLFVRHFYSPIVTLEDLNQDSETKNTLDTPQNKNDALKTFLDKTKEV